MVRAFAALAISVALVAGCTPEAKRQRDAPAAARGPLVHFAGDVYFGESYDTPLSDLPDEERYLASVEGLRDALEGGPVIANLESTMAAPDAVPVDDDKAYLHRSRPAETADALAALGFAGLSLSNNHAMDYGVSALQATRRTLVDRGIAPFGAGTTREQARQPYELDLAGDARIAVLGAFWYRPSYRDRYRFYADDAQGGVRELDTDIAAQIRDLKTREPERLVIVFPHWGRNYRWRTKRQREMARGLIDAGADLVIGHGSHAYQQVERYRERWILYGLGNLAFLSPGRYAEHDVPAYSMIASLRFQHRRELVLRFIASDNLATNYRPHAVDGDAFDAALAALRERSCRLRDAFCERARVDADSLSPFVRLEL